MWARPEHPGALWRQSLAPQSPGPCSLSFAQSQGQTGGSSEGGWRGTPPDKGGTALPARPHAESSTWRPCPARPGSWCPGWATGLLSLSCRTPGVALPLWTGQGRGLPLNQGPPRRGGGGAQLCHLPPATPCGSEWAPESGYKLQLSSSGRSGRKEMFLATCRELRRSLSTTAPTPPQLLTPALCGPTKSGRALA